MIGDTPIINKTTMLMEFILVSISILRVYLIVVCGNSDCLRQRVRQFVQYGYGLVKNHRGGRYLAP